MTVSMKRRPIRRPSKARAAEAVAPRTPLLSGRTQDELRDRRRGGLGVAYVGDFGLSTEVGSICRPLASRIAGLSDVHDERGLGVMFMPRIGELVDAIHGALIFGITGWFADIDARERVQRDGAHLDPASRAAAVKNLVTLAPRPREPVIEPADLVSGQWVQTLVDLAAPFDHRLADLLGRAHPPGDERLRGRVSRSDKLVELLREVDHAARQLDLRIDTAERGAATRRTTAAAAAGAPPAAVSRADAARNALRDMGIEA